MWNLWRLLGAQRCIFPTSVHMSLCFSNSFESLEPKNTIVPRHFSAGCYTGVCRSSPPLSWSVCVRVCLNIWLPVSLEPLEIATLDGCASASPSPLSSVTHKLEVISFGQSADQIWLEASEASLTLFITSVIVPLHSFALSIWPILLLVDSLLKSLSRFFFFLANGETLEESAFSSLWVWNPLCSCPSTLLISPFASLGTFVDDWPRQ